MLDLYYWPTPNGHKITLLLEELGLEYRILPVNIGRGEQFAPDFLRISPNNRIPALIDHHPEDGGEAIALFESGAILLYLAQKTQQLLPVDLRGRNEVIKWLFWQVGGLGPMAGQNHHFNQYAPIQIPYAIERYEKETARLYGVLNRQLEGGAYIAGAYSIADIACYPWIVPYESQHQKLEGFPHLQRWFERIRARPATARAYAKASIVNPDPPTALDAEARRILFGQDASRSERD